LSCMEYVLYGERQPVHQMTIGMRLTMHRPSPHFNATFLRRLADRESLGSMKSKAVAIVAIVAIVVIARAIAPLCVHLLQS
jgi:hypothetical protein